MGVKSTYLLLKGFVFIRMNLHLGPPDKVGRILYWSLTNKIMYVD